MAEPEYQWVRFVVDEREYEIAVHPDGIRVRRCGRDLDPIGWRQFVEFIDGQKLLPI